MCRSQKQSSINHLPAYTHFFLPACRATRFEWIGISPVRHSHRWRYPVPKDTIEFKEATCRLNLKLSYLVFAAIKAIAIAQQAMCFCKMEKLNGDSRHMPNVSHASEVITMFGVTGGDKIECVINRSWHWCDLSFGIKRRVTVVNVNSTCV